MTVTVVSHPLYKHGDDEVFVVETHDDIYLGQLVLDWDTQEVHIYNGFVGRPVVLDSSEVVRVTLASRHPDVEVL